MHIDPKLATLLAVVLLVAGAVIVITSGDSVSVRFLTALVTLDVARASTPPHRSDPHH